MTHYSVINVEKENINGIDLLFQLFPDGEANEMNFVLFSTSGVHGSYNTIEDCIDSENEHGNMLTYLVVHPRLVCLKYGTLEVTRENVDFLKKLRDSSSKVVSEIGY